MKTQKLSKEYLTALGNRLKLIRTYLRYDQKQMSEVLETAQSQISKLEMGRSSPSLYQLLQIKKLTEEDEYLKENLTWVWILEGQGKGIFK
jgi:transcriptional regulator with XRE-family HTH domain